MEQRRYRSTLTPEALGDLLVQHYAQERRTEAQRLGSGDSVLVQIRRGHEDRRRVALTIGISRAGAEEAAAVPGITIPADAPSAPAPAPARAPELVVTVGEQEWLGGHMEGAAVLGSLIGALFTPWALFGLIWPITQAIGEYVNGGEVWKTIDNLVLVQGGTLVSATELAHPHAGGR